MRKSVTQMLLRRDYDADVRDSLERQEAFLEALATHVRIRTACKEAGIKVSEVSRWLRDDVMFRQRYEEVQDVINMIIEDEAVRRAFNGWKQEVYQKGELVGYKRMYSDDLMSKLLRARMPQRWGNIEDNNANLELTPLLILPVNGRELLEAEPELQRFEVPRQNEIKPMEEIIDRAAQRGEGLFEEEIGNEQETIHEENQPLEDDF